MLAVCLDNYPFSPHPSITLICLTHVLQDTQFSLPYTPAPFCML